MRTITASFIAGWSFVYGVVVLIIGNLSVKAGLSWVYYAHLRGSRDDLLIVKFASIALLGWFLGCLVLIAFAEIVRRTTQKTEQ